MSLHSSKRGLILVPLAALLIAGCSPDGQDSSASPAAPSNSVGESVPSTNRPADETLITGTVDGQPASWSLEPTQSDFTGDANFGTVSVRARKVSGPEGTGTIAFGFQLSGGQPKNPEITLDGGGVKRSFYLSPSSTAPLTLSKVEKSGEQLQVSGYVSAILGYSEDFGRTIDDSKKHAVDLTFDIKLNGLSL
jgi:hypothetical protein